jgi:hypothetical protein
MSHTKTHAELAGEINAIKEQIFVGATYFHYKNPTNLYLVVDIAVQEATEKLCVIYKALYEPHLTFVRDVDSWLEQVNVDGKMVDRFTLTQEKK